MYASTGEAAAPDLDELVGVAAEVLRLLADPTRFKLVLMLQDNERAVGSLADEIGRPIAGVSQHLAKLRMARLVSTRRVGTSVLYRVDDDHVRQLVTDTIHHVEHMLTDAPRHHAPASRPEAAR
jgi:DNA-binding transcriptional ArsR family regulator